MSEFKFDKKDLLDKTNGGLDVIKRLFPECEKNGKFVHFKLRDESTPSANVFEAKGIYLVNDHGDGGKSMNAIDLVMLVEGLSFPDACKWIAAEFQINGQSTGFAKADFEMKKATKKQKPGECYFEFKPFTDNELSVLGPVVFEDSCDKVNLKSCKSVTRIKKYENHPVYGNDTMQIIIKSNDRFPIFAYDFGTWQKIYQPFAKKDPDNPKSKDHRFSYAGDKPADYIFGLEDVKKRYNELKPESEGDVPKLDKIIIASGDRDGVNAISLDYPTVWLNSETATLEHSLFALLQDMAHEVYYIGDIDNTGKRETIKRALNFIDLKIVWLPEWLREGMYQDKPRKDFTDFTQITWQRNKNKDHLVNQVKNLLNDALPARFWDYDPAAKKQKYSFNNEACYRFLNYNGYYRFEEEFAKEDFTFIRLQNGIVERVKTHHLANFPGEYLRSKRKPISLLNFIHRSAQLNEKSLSKLQLRKIDFKDCSYNSQLMFFQNKVWEVTKDGIKEKDYRDLKETYVWKDKIIPHDVRLNNSPSFKITHNGTNFDIEILNENNHFLNYLINTSRVHWRKCGDTPFKMELNGLNDEDQEQYQIKAAAIERARTAYREANRFNIAEEGLTAEEIQEQKDHLINKLFSYGYLLHKQKIDDRSWCVFAMDHRISDVADSNGGSGKSVMFDKAVRSILLSNQYKAGRDTEALKNKHMYEGIDKNTDYVLFDDLDARFPFSKLFSEITGDLAVNPKHGKQYVLSFQDSPKFAITSNFGLFKADSSTNRRILYTVFSDYYHYKSDDDAKEHKPPMDFDGKMLFTQFTPSEWNDFFSVSAQALQFYLGENTKIGPPMGNVEKRNSLQSMGDGFKDWADSYLTSSRLNEYVVKEDAIIDFEQKSKLKNWTSQRFKKALQEWCKYYGYELNPQELINSGVRIVRSVNGGSKECYFIKTGKIEKMQQEIERRQAAALNTDVDTDDLPF